MARIDITVDTSQLELAPVELDTHLVDADNDLADMGRAPEDLGLHARNVLLQVRPEMLLEAIVEGILVHPELGAAILAACLSGNRNRPARNSRA
ncbi:hypothetical protein [Methylobacterium sp. 88A]|uniref:hypothetical protein n=1 Tax=Methylobacterium sp. 88A TaxID=1131813 RepID=UPI00035DAB6E|nr:hypothetical protein [Methylobacterium sp. 88A]